MTINSSFDIWYLDQKFNLWRIWAEELGAAIKAEEDMPYENPFTRTDSCWYGKIISLDDAETDDIREDDLYRVLVCGSTPSGWDGTTAGIVLLKDGRWCGWVSDWGPTGSGFHADAYGGYANIYVSNDPELIRQKGLSAEGRFLCGISYPEDNPHI